MKKFFNTRRLAAMLCLTAALLLMVMMRAGSVRAEENDQAKPDNGIPVIYLNIDESEGTIEEMLASKDHSVYCYGTLSIEVPEGFHYSDFEDLPCESLSDLAMSIRGRGNTTWAHEGKRPFKIKLDKKTDVFGLGKNKHWVLVANAFDETLLRDRVTAWLADQLGFEFTPRGVPVDLVMKGQVYGEQYLGSYYFSENVRVDDNRLEIDELSEDMTEEPEITGGYLLQNPSQLADDSPNRFKTSRGTEWATETPSFDTSDDGYENEAQQKYIQNHLQKVEDALFADGTEYRELMDIESSAKYWLINEMTKNSDGYGTGSTYIYKKRDKDGVTGKVYWGPVWDFDQGWDRVFNVNDFTCGGDWVVPMFCDREEGGFVEEVQKQWQVLKQAMTELTREGGIIDRYYAETKASAEKDRQIWHPDETDFNYLKEVNELKDWACRRFEWMDENFSQVSDLAHKVKFMADGELYALQFKPAGDMIHGNEEHPDKEGYYFTGWADEEGNIIGYNTPVKRDMVLTAQYVAAEDATHAEDITFRKNNDVVTFSIYFRIYPLDYEIIPADAIDKAVEWSVSDESFATVDRNGMLTLAGKGPGEVTVYAKLGNGVEREFTLTVISEDVPAPESVYPLEETIYMTPGQMKPFIIDTVPSPAKISEYEYVSDDESVVTVDEYGVLTAVGPGQTAVHLTAKTPGDSWDDFIVCETEITVIVTDTEPEPEIEYTVVSGDQSAWKQGSEDGLTIIVKRSANDEECFSHFKDVLIDGKLLEKDRDYLAAQGSTVITVKASALNQLAAGEHTVTAVFDDGTAETKVTIAAEDPDPAPDTSDHRDNSWPAYLGASLIVFVLAFAVRRKYAGTR